MPDSTLDKPAATPIGRPIDRVDGRLKVTGQARYAAEAPVQGVAHAVLVESNIARGTIASIDTSAAEAQPGVLAVVTSKNMPKLSDPRKGGGMTGENRLPLSDDNILYAGQHVAVVLANTLEQARHAADLVKVAYDPEPPMVALHDVRAEVVRPEKNFGEPLQVTIGDVDAALKANPAVVVQQTYTTPVEHHNPMEMSATVAAWDGDDRLTVWDSTQYMMGTRATLAAAFGLPAENVRTICPFVGGAFGCKGAQWPHTLLAAAAAKVVRRPVKLMLTRQQMFTSCGHRPPTEQTLTLAADSSGKLLALRHETNQQASIANDFIEPCGIGTSRILYATPAMHITHAARKMNVGSPTFMRAPGETPGTYALECAMDELAVALKMDPVALRRANHADVQPENKKPWSSKHLRECYQMGIEKFGWSKRKPEPRSMRHDDGRLIGWGMATATYPGYQFPGTARIRLMSNGSDGVRAVGSSATHDLGTGAYTVCTQITAGLVGLPLDRVKFELGDSTLPPAPVSGGSTTTASVGQALSVAADALKSALLKLATDGNPSSKLAGAKLSDLVMRDGKLMLASDPSRSEDLAALVARAGRAYVEGTSPPPGEPPQARHAASDDAEGEDYAANQKKYAFQSFGAHFVEVMIDEPIGRCRVTRVVSVMDVGRVINPKTAGSQVMGGVIMGIGMALMEETAYDQRSGKPVTNNLADYPVCVNADIHSIEPYFIDIPDPRMNAVGCRGVGEIGITGVAAAVANAVYHATGKRIRDLPITTDKLM